MGRHGRPCSAEDVGGFDCSACASSAARRPRRPGTGGREESSAPALPADPPRLIYPVDQSHVDAKYSRPLSDRSITVRYIWPDLVSAWAARDEAMVDEIWDDVITDLDSDYAAYAYVSSVGIGA
ncbi:MULTISPECIES: hypothetical protein [Streptomyces]|uniref:Uncharacterized protein n=1 Tax=Streptomyces virginiae TaxID=1961 RepID=A0ABZ1T3U6_STRVG|nr:hypothetical protein [Streptomyces virginiae]